MIGKPYEPLHLQRYRLRRGITRDHFVIWAEWLEMDGVYEGRIDHMSLDYPYLRIRLLHPTDPNLSFLVKETYLDEVD